jgi:mycothiol system anti-sigma-R factor
MKCRDALDLVHAYIDGELDLVKSLEIEQHLEACASCKVEFDHMRELGSVIRAHAACHAAPQALRARIAASLPREPRQGSGRAGWGWGRMAAALAVVTLFGLGFGLVALQPGAEERLAREVVAGHVRSLMVDHLMDIASSDQHAVKPWIAGKLEFSPPVKDLAAQGYALAGGRLDYVSERSVMALIYRRHAHVINLFVWPDSAGADAPPRAVSHQGYNLVHFKREGMVFWAVSDLNAEELKAFTALL